MTQIDQTIKQDADKPQLSLVPCQIIRDIAEVREYGVRKYGNSESWKQVTVERYTNALYRHMLAFVENPNSVDSESEIPHYKHMACNLAFICELMRAGDLNFLEDEMEQNKKVIQNET